MFLINFASHRQALRKRQGTASPSQCDDDRFQEYLPVLVAQLWGSPRDKLVRKKERTIGTRFNPDKIILQIVAANKGYIPGTLVYKAKPTNFGGIINVTPPALTLEPEQYKSFNLSFSSNRKGDFMERVDFIIKESLEVVSLHIKYDLSRLTPHRGYSLLK